MPSPTRKLRVVYVDHVARLSGGELALLRTLPALLDDVDPLVLLAETGPLVPLLGGSGIRVDVLPMNGALRDTRKEDVSRIGTLVRQGALVAVYVARLTYRLRRDRPDLVHTNSLKAALYGGLAGRLAGVPVVWHVRDRIAPDYLPSGAVRMVHLASHLLPSAIITNSQSTLDTLPRGRSHRRVLANPVVPDAVLWPRTVSERADRPVTMGIVGRLSPWKGQDLFLRAFARAFPEGPERARIIGGALFGEDDWEVRLRQLAKELGIADRVEFRGHRDDVWSELAAIDVLVHASTLPEPFGQVILEGMAGGLPVVAAGEGGPAELVTHNVDGLLVPPRDEGALAQALLRLAKDPELREQLGTRALLTAAGYTPGRTADGVLAVYRSVLRSQRV